MAIRASYESLLKLRAHNTAAILDSDYSLLILGLLLSIEAPIRGMAGRKRL